MTAPVTKARKKKVALGYTGCKPSNYFLLRHLRRRVFSTKTNKKIYSGNQNWPAASEDKPKDTVDEAAVSIEEQDDKEKTCQSLEHWTNRMCNICGGRYHTEHFCPYNYVDGPFGLDTCRENCRPGQQQQHPPNQAALRRFVRVTNVPWSLSESELGRLFELFGPLLMCSLTRVTSQESVSFSYVMFRSREDAEEAIDRLNGYIIDGRSLRVDWAYPRA